jgi:CHAT domain-containing protein
MELSGGDRLTLRDLLDGDIRLRQARLAVLSACETAVTDYQTLPDEVLGLPAGFLQAGVPGVLATLWRVEDLSAALFMIRFYELHLGTGRNRDSQPLPPPRALQSAQQWLRDATSGELASYFEARLARLGENPQGRPFTLAGVAQFSLADPQDRPFAGSPENWAPFVFIGT